MFSDTPHHETKSFEELTKELKAINKKIEAQENTLKICAHKHTPYIHRSILDQYKQHKAEIENQLESFNTAENKPARYGY